MKISKLFAALISCLCVSYNAVGQGKDFSFKRALDKTEHDGWYKFYLPSDIFTSIDPQFSDIRIYHLTPNDTIEQPFLIRVLQDKITDEDVTLPMLNKSKKDGASYATFELSKNQSVNFLEIGLDQENFNGYAQLEGSTDQREWFMIDTLQRILSIKNNGIDFKANTISFPTSNYHFLRLKIKADKQVDIISATFKNRVTKYETKSKITISYRARDSKQEKQTVIEVSADAYRPIDQVSIVTGKQNDFYRPITISAIRDSIKTPKGWSYYYDDVFSGYITSLNDSSFHFPYVLARKLKITIYNQDNQPLKIAGIAVNGPLVEITAKLTAGDNFLFYGNETLTAPSYDITHFADKIPESIPEIGVHSAEKLKMAPSVSQPFFVNVAWIWGLMALIMVVLGYFTLKMITQKNQPDQQ